MDGQELSERAKNHVKREVKRRAIKAILAIMKKLLLKLVLLIVKAMIAATAALIGVIGLPLAFILAIVIIIGGAMFFLAPSLGLIDEDSPVSQQEIRTQLEVLIENSSDYPNYRPPFELISSIDMMRIIQEDLNPWEVNFAPLVSTLTPELTYQDFEDTYEIKTVITTTKEVSTTESRTETYQEPGQVGTRLEFVCTEAEFEGLPFEIAISTCYKHVPVYGMETKTREVKVPVTKTETEIDTDYDEQLQKVTFLKTAHAWNRYETFYYKEIELNNEFELVEETEEGNKKTEVYKRKTKEWILDGKDFEHYYNKFDKVLSDLQLETSAIMLLVEALKENNIPLDGYMGTFFDIFIGGGMGMMIPQEYMTIYKSAEKQYNVHWNYLAAIHYVETKFSTVHMVSSVGAIGHMQFMPCTHVGWAHPTCGGVGKGNIPDHELTDPAVIARYGGLGVDANGDGKSDPWDLEDAVYSAANLLKRNGFESGIKRAVRSYNHSDKYVADVVHFAELFKSSQGSIPPITEGTFTRPAIGPITSGYGHRWGSTHQGVDIGKVAEVVPIVAAADGTVTRSYLSTSYGETIIIQHIIDGQIWETLYAHMVSGSRRVHVGEQVGKGQIIGLMGNTGRSTGPHLHFEIHKGNWNLNKSNAVDPTRVIQF